MTGVNIRTYKPTEVGEAIAVESGLKAMAERLVADDKLGPLVDRLSSSRSYLYDEEPDDQVYIQQTWQSLNDTDRTGFVRGLKVDEGDNWRRLGEPLADTLFTSPEVVPFTSAVNEDRLVLSGLIGLQYLNYRGNCRLLARSRYQEFGFDKFIDAASFVGAYVLHQTVLAEVDRQNKYYGPDPSFRYVESGAAHKISVGATMDGDLRIYEDQHLLGAALAPNDKFVEFSPQTDTIVGAYHSTEPGLTAAMMEYALLSGDKPVLKQLVGEFEAQLQSLAAENGRIDYKIGNFGDYGSSGVDYEFSSIKALMQEDGFRQRRQLETELHSSPYLPQSRTHFEILKADDGLLLQNRDTDSGEIGSQIHIPRQVFGELFNALVRQAQAGLGRTSPVQHIHLIHAVERLLA